MRNIVSAPQSTAASAAGIHATCDIYLWWGPVVGSLDKHISNEKEFILASAGVGGGLYLCGDNL